MLLKLELLSRLMTLGLLFVTEYWTAVAAPCSGSALRADFFFNTCSRLLTMGLLLFAEEWIVLDAAEAWIPFCHVSIDPQIGLCKDFKLTVSDSPLY